MPLAILAAWEEHIVSPACTPAVGLLLGALLLCAHCSLRFGDIQRIKPSALSLSAQALRGLCWATKTTNQGQPFACLPFGFRGKDIVARLAQPSTRRHSGRMGRFLRARLHSALHAKSGFRHLPQPFTPHVVLASIGVPPLGNPVALEVRRRLVTQDEAASFTLHSLKCSLLSAAAQLRLPEDSRRLQGHHISSALLCSRDDTIEALWVQSELASAIRRGWRPPRPMARGGQHPTVEPVFQVPQESPPGQLELPSLPPSLARFLYYREVDNLLSAALNTDEEALAVERAALDSSEAESEELPDENPHSPELHRTARQHLSSACAPIRCLPFAWTCHAQMFSFHQTSLQTCLAEAHGPRSAPRCPYRRQSLRGPAGPGFGKRF